MVNVNKAVIARFKKNGKNFEILVDCDKALEMKKGLDFPFDEVFATTEIFSDVKQDEKPTNEELDQAFGTTNVEEISKQIVFKGEIQITAEHKNKMREDLKNKIINIIHKNAINPKTNLPHPPQRIESAIDEAKIKIDEFKSAETQVRDIVKQLTSLIPIKFEIRELSVKISAEHAGKSYHILKEFGKILKDEWQNDGSLLAILELPAGMQIEFEDNLYKSTQGEAEIKILNKK